MCNRLSVIVPTHGRVDLFEQTLATIEAQTWDEFELIVTDDSAMQTDQDAIEAAVEQYRNRTKRSARYVFTSPKLGQAANTNQGLHAASGQILRILHSDDLVRPGLFRVGSPAIQAVSRDQALIPRLPSISGHG